eukprot:1518035-Amphidinium_carterae.1
MGGIVGYSACLRSGNGHNSIADGGGGSPTITKMTSDASVMSGGALCIQMSTASMWFLILVFVTSAKLALERVTMIVLEWARTAARCGGTKVKEMHLACAALSTLQVT